MRAYGLTQYLISGPFSCECTHMVKRRLIYDNTNSIHYIIGSTWIGTKKKKKQYLPICLVPLKMPITYNIGIEYSHVGDREIELSHHNSYGSWEVTIIGTQCLWVAGPPHPRRHKSGTWSSTFGTGCVADNPPRNKFMLGTQNWGLGRTEYHGLDPHIQTA